MINNICNHLFLINIVQFFQMILLNVWKKIVGNHFLFGFICIIDNHSNFSLAFPISSSSVTEQFDINSNENIYTVILLDYDLPVIIVWFSFQSNKPVDTDSSLLTSKPPGHKVATSSERNQNIIPSDYSLVNRFYY